MDWFLYDSDLHHEGVKPRTFHIQSFLSFLSRGRFSAQPNNYDGAFWENIFAKAPSEITGGANLAFVFNLLIRK